MRNIAQLLNISITLDIAQYCDHLLRIIAQPDSEPQQIPNVLRRRRAYIAVTLW